MNRSFTSNRSRSRAILAGVCSVVFAATLSAQETTVKLPKADSSASFQVKDSGSVVKLRQNGDGGFYLGGTFGTGAIPATGAGVRMMWYPAKAAFRAGYIDGTQWDDASVGNYSTAMGLNGIASGIASTVFGRLSVASGYASTASGFSDTASGYASIATGCDTKASNTYCTAMGNGSKASGQVSTAIGSGDTARASFSTAIGENNVASGIASTAMGAYTIASGNYSTAMGYSVSTAGYDGAFIIGDYSTGTTTNATAASQMTMRFAGGYRLFTDANVSVGVSLAPGGSSWATISDSTKKTNFQKADGDYFLSSLSKLKLGSWNYKAQDTKNYRHYGPMAQEIFHYFGHDGKGTIGCDTLLASADMDGIMMICLQALEKRTGELQKANEKIAALQSSVDEMKAEMMSMKNELQSLAATQTGKSLEKIALNTSSKGQ
jgi:FtsZ-binding cell division protein ZapB